MRLKEHIIFSKPVQTGIYFILLGVIVNYLYRLVFHQIGIERIFLGSDPHGYYQYMPTFFLENWSNFDHLFWAKSFGDGKTLNVFTCGVAILWSPFFLAGHLVSQFLGLETNGYGPVYFGVSYVGALFYCYIGLLFLYKTISEEFAPRHSFKSVALFFLGTNIFYYSMIMGAGMSHLYSFTLISVNIYYTRQYFKDYSLKYAVYVAITLALAVLIRPTNIISGFYFFSYGVSGWKQLGPKLKHWIINYRIILLFLFLGILVAFPQMLYWHKVTGNWIVYSYQHEHFDNWKNPKIGIVLFGLYNGWFLYTPLVIFAIVGLFATLKRNLYQNWLIILILGLSIYINASWWAPTFSSACGQRAMVDFLPFLALPWAWFLNKAKEFPKAARILFTILILVILFYNIQFAFRYRPVEWWETPMDWMKFWQILSFK